MGNPNIIATLIAPPSLVMVAGFQLNHNSRFYQAPEINNAPSNSEGDTPPPVAGPLKIEATHRVILSFDREPRNLQKGFVFGTGLDADIHLVDNAQNPLLSEMTQGISAEHFSISFQSDRQLVLRNLSQYGTAVAYAKNPVIAIRNRAKFPWILFPRCKEFEVFTSAREVHCTIRLESHEDCQAEYLQNVDQLFQKRGIVPPPPVRALNVQSPSFTANTSSAFTRSAKDAIFVGCGRLDEGTFGVVTKQCDASTGKLYACKTYKTPIWRREAEIMEQVEHVTIVRFARFFPTPVPALFMELAPLGSLEAQCSVKSFTTRETCQVMMQSLDALSYLHAEDYIHRDIKPSNVLVFQRDTSIWIKLADFGLAKDSTDGLERHESSFCWGTTGYAAPELFARAAYDCKIDVWSLGGTLSCIGYMLSPEYATIEDLLKWWDATVITLISINAISADLSDPIIPIITGQMLQKDPKERATSAECFQLAKAAFLTLDDAPDLPVIPAMPPQVGLNPSFEAKLPHRGSHTPVSQVHQDWTNVPPRASNDNAFDLTPAPVANLEGVLEAAVKRRRAELSSSGGDLVPHKKRETDALLPPSNPPSVQGLHDGSEEGKIASPVVQRSEARWESQWLLGFRMIMRTIGICRKQNLSEFYSEIRGLV